ncbi:MAG TPA: long-chain-fatty-acid--CoA ligase [Desulfobacteraceae bacterium]|nr:long-chain-fatty-acid--CoA ligase [Desulfobacteraceae bacterium]HPJ68132.1 long-chain-fatty-acid--CoA ligase [Desulfobacteraceae bacterium]
MKNICTLRTFLTRNLEYNSEKTALIEGERQYSFRDFADRANRMGNALLSLGVNKGDRVAVLSHNSIECAECYFNIPNAGLILVMINFRLAAGEIKTILEDSGAAVLIVDKKYVDSVEQIRDKLPEVRHFVFIGEKSALPKGYLHYESMIDGASSSFPEISLEEDDLAALIYTSGTTGAPKGCMATHRNLYHAGRSLNIVLNLGEKDVEIIASPLFHATGISCIMPAVYAGLTSVIMPQWDVAEFLRLVETYRVSTGMIATPMLLFLVDYPDVSKYDVSSLKYIFFAGAPVTPVIYKKAIEIFGNVFIHLFGTSETVGHTAILMPGDVERALETGNDEIFSSCGRSSPDMESMVVDDADQPVTPGVVGEIKVRGLGTTLGYWNKKEMTGEVYRNGWYYPLDLCRVDDRGYIYVVDRKKDMIITGGENVYPAEVENVLYKHPNVRQVSVIGLPDPKWGEVVTAVVVPKNGADFDPDELRDFCRKEIAGYKTPKKVIFMESLPMGTSGKILKYRLRDDLIKQIQ